MTQEKIYDRSSFKPVPGEIGDLLEGVGSYGSERSWMGGEVDHRAICERMIEMEAEPFSIVVYCEHLDRKHRYRKKYVEMSREKLVSELDETVWRHFYDRINEEMRRYLEHSRDPDDEHLKTLVEKYRPEALEILTADYEEFYPRSWKKKLEQGKHTRPRTRIKCERRFEMPEPFNWWDERNAFQQYYVIPQAASIARGGSGSSQQREIHSAFGFAFALFSGTREVPTHFLVYDKDNELRFLDSFERLCLVRYDLGSNYSIEYEERERLLEGVGLIHHSWDDDKLTVSWNARKSG